MALVFGLFGLVALRFVVVALLAVLFILVLFVVFLVFLLIFKGLLRKNSLKYCLIDFELLFLWVCNKVSAELLLLRFIIFDN